MIEVLPGHFRKVTDFEFSGGLGQSASYSCGVNSSGQVAFSAFFTKVTNTTRGIMIANRPSTFADWIFWNKVSPGQDGPGDDANGNGVPNIMA